MRNEINENHNRKVFINEIKRLETELRNKYMELGFSEESARTKYSFSKIEVTAEREIIEIINSMTTPFEILELLSEERHFSFVPNMLNTFITQNHQKLTNDLINSIDKSKLLSEEDNFNKLNDTVDFDSSNENQLNPEISNKESKLNLDIDTSNMINSIKETNNLIKEPKVEIDFSEIENEQKGEVFDKDNLNKQSNKPNKIIKDELLKVVNNLENIEDFNPKNNSMDKLFKSGMLSLDEVINDLDKEGKLNKNTLETLLKMNEIFKEATSEERIKSVRLNISKNPSTNSGTLSELRKIDDKDINISIAKHHKTDPQTLESLYKNDINQKLELALSGNTNTPSIVLENLSNTRNLEVKFKLLKNRNLPSEAISNIFEFKMNQELLVAISKHRNISSEVVSELVDMGDIETIKELFKNKKIDNTMFEKILNNGDLELLRKLSLIKSSITDEQLNSLMMINDKDINLNLLKREEIGSVEIDKISKTDDIDILLAVIKNPKTHENTLFVISEKEIPELELSLSKNKNINAGTIDIIVENIIERNQEKELNTNSEDFQILKNIGSNPNMYILTAEKLTNLNIQENFVSKQLLNDMKEFVSLGERVQNTRENIYNQIGSPLWLSSKLNSNIKIEPATDLSMTFAQGVEQKYEELEQLKEIERKSNKELWVETIKTNIGIGGK